MLETLIPTSRLASSPLADLNPVGSLSSSTRHGLVGWLVGWLLGWLVGWLVGVLVGDW